MAANTNKDTLGDIMSTSVPTKRPHTTSIFCPFKEHSIVNYKQP